jgi:hypothetical protein
MFPTLFNDLIVLSGLAARFPQSRLFGRPDRTWANQEEAAEVDWVPGAYSIISAEALAAAGPFDPAIFHLLRRSRPMQAHQAKGVFDLVLAGYLCGSSLEVSLRARSDRSKCREVGRNLHSGACGARFSIIESITVWARSRYAR